MFFLEWILNQHIFVFLFFSIDKCFFFCFAFLFSLTTNEKQEAHNLSRIKKLLSPHPHLELKFSFKCESFFIRLINSQNGFYSFSTFFISLLLSFINLITFESCSSQSFFFHFICVFIVHLKNIKFAHKCFSICLAHVLMMHVWTSFSYHVFLRFTFFSYHRFIRNRFIFFLSVWRENKVNFSTSNKIVKSIHSFSFHSVMTRLHNWVHIELCRCIS